MIEKKNFLLGLDSDSNPRELRNGSMLNLMNSRVGVTEYGRNFRCENIPGTTLVSQQVFPPYGTMKTIGTTIDEQTQRLIFFNYNTFSDHGIYCYDIATNRIYAVLYDSQVTGGLNFSRDSLIHSAKVINGMLYWVDGTNNQPRSLNIDAAIKSNDSSFDTEEHPYTLPVNFSEITLIKPPPPLAPNIVKDTDATFLDIFIGNESFRFAFMYEYYTNEETVIGTWSVGSRLNKVDETNNFISVTMDTFERIPNSVRFVNLVVRVGNTAKIIKTWDKEVTEDRNEMILQNSGLQALTYDFYNNVTGRVLSPDLILKPFDSVPIYSEALESARNRAFLGNNTEGYDTPTSTSLSLSLTSINISQGGILSKQLIAVGLSWALPNRAYSAFYVYLTQSEAVPQGYYEITSTVQTNNTLLPPTLPAAPTSVAFSALNFRGANQSDVVSYVKNSVGGGDVQIVNGFVFSASNVDITGISVTTYDVFKSRTQYKAGIVFYDFAMRKCGVVTNDGSIFEIPARDYAYSTGINGVVWTVSNTNALTEIPDWAYYYAPVRTLNLTTRFFVDSFTNTAKYATKDNDGQYVFTNSTFVTGSVGIALDSTALYRAGLGYTFTEGDIAVITDDTDNTYELPVVGQVGNYIIVKTRDIGNLTNRRLIYEIFTPYQTSEQEPFYEVGNMYRILNPGTDSRAYETLSDIFIPDSYVLTRNFGTETYFAEAMCPNDLFYQRWDNDTGKITVVVKIGQEVKTQSFRFSNTYIPGTQTNGLSTFEALNQDAVSEDSGEIQKLILTTKVADKGSVMLAICTNLTNSIYLGETQIADATGATKFYAQTTGVVGTINDFKNSFGTINPESAFEYLGLVFWIDILNGVFVQYSQAGLEPVSRYNMSRFFKRYSKDYLAASTGNLDNINGFHHIRCCMDAFHKEVIVSLPGLIYENYAETLPSYTSVPSYATSIINRFDIYDELQKTIAFSFEENKWGSNFEYGAEWFEYWQNKLFGFKDGFLYIHNDNTANWNTFYGTERPIRLCCTGNFNPSALKDLFNVAIEGNIVPDFSVAMTNVPNIQISDLTSDDYTDQQGIFYADWFMDRLSPNSSGTADERLYTGDPLTDFALFFMFEFQQYDELKYINFVDIGYDISRGQKQILNQVNT